MFDTPGTQGSSVYLHPSRHTQNEQILPEHTLSFVHVFAVLQNEGKAGRALGTPSPFSSKEKTTTTTKNATRPNQQYT